MSVDDRLDRAATEAAHLCDDVAVPVFTPSRRRGPLVAAGVSALMVASLLVATVVRAERGTDLNIVTADESTTTSSAAETATTPGPATATATSTTTPRRPTVSTIVARLEVDRPVPLRVFTMYAVDLNVGEVAVVDLEAATAAVYPKGGSVLTGLLDGAAMTPERDLIVWTYPLYGGRHAHLFTGGETAPDLTVADLELQPFPDDPNPGANSGLRVVPTPGGETLWVVRAGTAYADIDVPTSVDLIEARSGRRLASFEAEPNAFPAGATDAGLVLTTERLFDTGDGWMTEPGSERVVVLATDGSLTEVGPGRALTAAADTIVRLVCVAEDPRVNPRPDCELVIGDALGVVTHPGDGRWAPVGGPKIPSESMPLPSISPDGRTLLVAFGEDPDANGTPARSTLYAVDLGDGSARDIANFEGRYPLATWSVDGRWIAVLGGRFGGDDHGDITFYDRADPTTSFTVEEAIPEGHLPLAAG